MGSLINTIKSMNSSDSFIRKEAYNDWSTYERACENRRLADKDDECYSDYLERREKAGEIKINPDGSFRLLKISKK